MTKFISFIFLSILLFHYPALSQNNQNATRNDNAGFYLLKNADLYFSKGKLLVAKEIYIDNIQFLAEQQKMNLSSILVMSPENNNEKSLAFKLVKDISDQNNPSVKAFLGKLYLYGIGTKRDSIKGVGLLNESVAAQNSDGYFNLAWLLRYQKQYDQSFDLFKKAAEGGNAMAMNNIGQIYSNGIGKAVNNDSAFYWFKKAGELGNGIAYANIGYMYYSGIGVEKDYKKAFEYLSLSNNNGNLDYSQLNIIGLCYLNGRGVDANYDSAYHYFYDAGSHGNGNGFTNIGVLYEFFKGENKTTRDSALIFYMQGASKGDVEACARIGKYFMKIPDVNKKGHGAAATYFKLGATYGNAECMVLYADMIKRGEVVEDDSFKYIPLLQEASLKGNSYADNLLGLAFDSLKNYSESAKYFRLGISRNNNIAMVNYADILRKRNPSDPLIKEYLIRAVKLSRPDGLVTIYEQFPEYKSSYEPFTKAVFNEVYAAAQSGGLNSKRMLTSFYFMGIGTPKDEDKGIENGIKLYNIDSVNANFIGVLFMNRATPDYNNAFKWCSIAVKRKDEFYPNATANMAFMYAKGFGTAKDTVKAMEYYLKSAEAGNTSSMGILGSEYGFFGKITKIDSTKGFYWIQKSALLGDASSLNNLGECYYTGLGTKKDLEKARYYYQLSVDKNEPIGKLSLGVLYLNGEGVEKDLNKAKMLFEEGCKGGIQEACDKLKSLK